jgi:hypothetical protein
MRGVWGVTMLAINPPSILPPIRSAPRPAIGAVAVDLLATRAWRSKAVHTK